MLKWPEFAKTLFYPSYYLVLLLLPLSYYDQGYFFCVVLNWAQLVATIIQSIGQQVFFSYEYNMGINFKCFL